MKFINRLKKQYIGAMAKKGVDRATAKVLAKRFVSLTLSFILTFSAIVPVLAGITFDSFGAETFFGQVYLDNSSGSSDAKKWLDPSDPRYSGISGSLGSQANPYIIKNGDELYSLSLTVKAGNKFTGEFIDLTGLDKDKDKDEIASSSFIMENTIDLRPFDGTKMSATDSVLWEPIGTKDHPFEGNVFSSTGVSIVNLTCPPTGDYSAGKAYGLFGYNSGTIGETGETIHVSAMQYRTQEKITSGSTEYNAPKDLDFTQGKFDSTILQYIGGVVAVNTRTVKNVSFGTGSFYDADKKEKDYNHVYSNGIKAPLNFGNVKETGSVTGFSVGGIVGYNIGGTVSDCSFTGIIYSDGENIGTENSTAYDDTFLNGDFGGIVGFSEGGKIENSFSNGDIRAESANYSSFGGIVGNARNNGEIKKCAFTGNVDIGVYYRGQNVRPASAGGIAGLLGNFTVSQCVSGGNVTSKYQGDESNANIVPAGGPAGGIVGRTSLSSNVTIDQSFSLGTIASGTFSGGIVGANGNSTTVSNSFSTSTIKVLSFNNQKSEFSIEASTGANGFGGLEGGTSANTGSTSNSYFAGTTLSSETGSLFGLKTGTATNVYFDSAVSPNNAVTKTGKTGEFDGNNSRKTTADFLSSGSIDLGNEFVKSAGAYPELKWVNDISTSATGIEKTIKALSKIATTVTFKADSTNSVANGNDYNTYQMQKNSIKADVLTDVANDASLELSVVKSWTENIAFNGEYDTGKIGGIYNSTAEVKCGYIPAKIELTRKLIKAVNQTEGSANSVAKMEDLQALLDVSRNASGAYTGSVFTLSNDIDGALTAPKARVTTADEKYSEINNLFCGELNGNGHKINEIKAEGSFTSMFGTSFFAKVHNISFGTVTLGTEADKLTLAGKYNALLISRAKGTDFDNINFDTVSADMTVVASDSSFAMLTAYLETPLNYYNVISNVNFKKVNVNVPNIKTNFNYGLISSLNQWGNDNNSNTKIELQKFSNIQVDEYVLRVGDPNNTKITGDSIGGLFGLAGPIAGNEIAVAENCVIKDIDSKVYVYEYNKERGQSGFGGIASLFTGGFENCHVSGKIIGPSGEGTTAITRTLTGGIVSYAKNDNSNSFNNCSFIGAIDGVITGGIVGKSDSALYFTNSYVQAEINADENSGVAQKKEAGGIIGWEQGGLGLQKMLNCFFVGSVNGENVGGLVGKTQSNSKIYNSYAKAILNISTENSNGSAGGLVGASVNDKGTLHNVTIVNSYFSGQLNGKGSKGGLVGRALVNKDQTGAGSTQYVHKGIVNSYFDKSIAGDNIPTISTTVQEEKEFAKILDAKCPVESGNIKASNMAFKTNVSGVSPYISETPTNYPQISYFANSVNSIEKKLSDQSTQIVFAVEPGSFMTSQPNFELQKNDASYDVERNETADGVYQKWDEVLDFVPGSGTEPYGKYTMGPKGNTFFTVQYKNFYGNNNLNMKYNINVKPFDYGEGTENDPYIIYDDEELIKYRDYLKNGFDTSTTYYKIGSVADGVVVGKPITIDLEKYDDWEPIVGAAGHLNGNNSVIKNIKCATGYQYVNKDTGKIEATYYGLFGSGASSADIKDLTLDNVQIQADSGAVGVRAGAFMGTSAGGTFTNIVVTNASINYNGSSSISAGGLVGHTSSTNLSVDQCAVYSDIIVNNNANAGGLVGFAESANIKGSAAYGTISNGKNLGGLIGQVSGTVSINGTASTVDLSTSAQSANVGGVIGLSSSKNLSTTVNDSFYGGRIIATGVKSSMGGMVGYGNAYNDYTSAHTFESADKISFIAPGIFDSESEIEEFISQKIEDMNGGTFFYNYDTNPYPTANVEFSGDFTYKNDKGETQRYSKKYSNSNEPVTLLGKTTKGKSNTYAMTQEQLAFTDKIQWTDLDRGYFPRPVWLKADINNTLTERDELYLNDMSRFYSTAVYYTNAGKAGDEKLSNVFVTGEAATWSGQKTTDSDKTKITSNKKMILATGEGSLQNLELTQTVNNVEFKKAVKFTPSIVPCGIADYSFYFANPKGMWVEEVKQDEETTIAYPWSLYTADQLRGIDSLLKGIPDENGLKVTNADYNVTPPEGKKLGETFALGVDIAGYEKIDGETFGYTEFLPIGSDQKPFNTTFNGLGHTVRNLALSTSAEKLTGLFGTVKDGEISNLGIAPFNVQISEENSVAGGIAAKLAGNSSINNSFSALSFSNKKDSNGTLTVGGLVGQSTGTGNSISNSFNTGAIYLIGSGTMAGGLVGDGTGIAITNSYVAGYVEAKNKGVLVGNKSGTATNCYYDIGATGNMDESNGAISQMPTKALLGNAFKDEEGLYPLQTAFASQLTDFVEISAIPVSLTNARSVTSGSVSYRETTIKYLKGLGEHSSVGTITLSDNNTKFEKANTGIAFLGVNYKNLDRTVVANLQCWYDAGLDNNYNFVINTSKELAEFAQIVNGTLGKDNNPNGNHEHTNIQNNSFKGWTVSLGSDIDLRTFANWVSIGTNASPFKGTFDGKGRVVANFAQTTPNVDGNTGVFGTVNGGTITNFGVASGNSSGGTLAGGIVANSIGATIQYCFNASSVSGKNAGGLVGKADSTTNIMFCYNMGVVNGTDLGAGIAATNDGGITNSYNTGIIQSAGTGAGIFASGNGTAGNCYNASYVLGEASTYPVVPSGAVNCSYDNNLLDYSGSVSGVKPGVEMTDDNIWILTSDEKYPELKCFAINSATRVMQDASELSVLKMNFGSGNYAKFVEAKLLGTVTTNDLLRSVSVSSENSIFDVAKDGDDWRIQPSSKAGSGHILAGLSSTVVLEHKYFAFSVPTMKVRYKFDFTKLFDGNPVANSKYRGDATHSTNTWSSVGTTHTISTSDDLIEFAKYAKDNVTKGHTFILDYSIDMNGKTLPMIGSEEHPFEGTFDGGFYTISNLSINGSGNVAMFGAIGAEGKVLNFKLNNFTVTAEKSTSSDMVVASIAAVNMGLVQNIGINEGKLTANNASSNQETYLGTLVAKNSGKIRGCYFIQKRASTEPFGIVHSSKSNQFVGGLVGDNTGSMTGCYLISNMFTNNIKAIAGNNHEKTDNILNCYFNVQGDNPPVNLQFAYDNVPWESFYVKEKQMKTKEFAAWLSSNLYAGTFEQGTVGEFIGSADNIELNGGLPYLALFQLANYDVGSYFNEQEKSMMLSVWNIAEGSENTFGSLNGLFAVDSLEYKYFNSIIINKFMQFDMTLLQKNINYEISTRIYGRKANYNSDVSNGTLDSGSRNVKDVSAKSENNPLLLNLQTETTGIDDPNLIVATISFKKGSDETPWGNYRIDTN